MFTKIVIAGTLVAALGSLKPSQISDSVGWQTLRKSAVIAFSMSR